MKKEEFQFRLAVKATWNLYNEESDVRANVGSIGYLIELINAPCPFVRVNFDGKIISSHLCCVDIVKCHVDTINRDFTIKVEPIVEDCCGYVYYYAWLPAFGKSACSSTGDTIEEAVNNLFKVADFVVKHYQETGKNISCSD
jgi:hypothetical protein